MDRKEFILGAAAAAAFGRSFPAVGAQPPAASPSAAEPLCVRFLGTGAADWNGRDERGECRRLSSVLVDRAILVDFTSTALDMVPADATTEVVFYTHSHGDHYQPSAALKRGVKRVYVHESWVDGARREFAAAAERVGVAAPDVRPLSFGETVTERGVAFTCVPANHATSRKGERAAMYLIEKGAERLLYATDTGGIPAEAARIVGIDAHVRDGKPITAFVMEATMGVDHADDFRVYTHSSVDTVARIVRVLTATKRYLPPPGRNVYLTHLARTLHGTQAEIAAAVPAPLAPAYDGLDWILG